MNILGFRKKVLPHFIMWFFLFAFVFPTNSVRAAEASEYQPVINGYCIKEYSINVEIEPDCIMDVTEIITVDYVLLKHGIYRTLPLSGVMKGTINHEFVEVRYLAQISDVSVKDGNTQNDIPFSISTSDGPYKIIIGDSKKEILGLHTYILHYRYHVKQKAGKDITFLAWNLIGNQWDTSINHMDFTVHLPKPLEDGDIACYTGYFGSSDTSRVQYTISDSTILGSLSGYLEAGEGITLQMNLPKGYFPTRKKEPIFLILELLCVMLAVGCLGYGIKYRYKKISIKTKTIEKLDKTPAQLSYMESGYVADRAIAAMLIYWAEKGYLEIHEEQNKDLSIVKTAEMAEEEKEYDKKFFYEIFADKCRISAKELGTNFYTTVKNYKNDSSQEFEQQGSYYDKRRKWLVQFLFSAGILIGLCAYALLFFNRSMGGIILTFVLTFFVGIVSLLCSAVYAIAEDSRRKGSYLIPYIIFTGYFGMLAAIGWGIGTMMLQPVLYEIGFLSAGACTLGGSIVDKWSEDAKRLQAEAAAYRLAVKELWRNQIKAGNIGLLEGYQAYIYLFELSKSYKSLKTKLNWYNPPWFYSIHTTTFTPFYFYSSLEQGMNSYASVSSPGGSDGGGGAGGGAGGGGGGSW